jgi:hypothetical protein
MFVPFNQMPPVARIWIYQANRDFAETEKDAIQTKTEAFLNAWTAHQQTLKASYSIFYNRFLVIALDEDYNQASGCSIDASVHFLQKIEQEFDLSLLDRSQVAFWANDAIKTEKLPNLKQKIKDGIIQANTPIFVNTVNSLADLNQNWQKPALETWLNKYF